MSPEVITATFVCMVGGLLNIIYTRVELLLKRSNKHWHRLCPGFGLFACSLFVLYLGAADWRLRFDEVLVYFGSV